MSKQKYIYVKIFKIKGHMFIGYAVFIYIRLDI